MTSGRGVLFAQAVLLAFVSSLGLAQGKGKMLHFVSLDFPPMIYKGEDGVVTGVATEMVQTIFEEMGYETTVQIHPWERSLKLVKEGKKDGIFTIYRTPERMKFIDYSKEKLIQQPVALFVMNKKKITFKGDFSNLKGMVIGTTNTLTYGANFKNGVNKHQIRTLNAPTLEASFKNLRSGKVDLVVSSLFPAQKTLEALGWDKEIGFLSQPVEVLSSYIGFSKAKKLGALIAGFDRRLVEFRRQGRHMWLLGKYQLNLPASFLRNYRPTAKLR